jgi:hypothetical protein
MEKQTMVDDLKSDCSDVVLALVQVGSRGLGAFLRAGRYQCPTPERMGEVSRAALPKLQALVTANPVMSAEEIAETVTTIFMEAAAQCGAIVPSIPLAQA